MLHERLRDLRNALGYEPWPEGVCALYAEKGIDAWLLGAKEFKVFEERNQKIAENKHDIPKLLQQAKEKIKHQAMGAKQARDVKQTDVKLTPDESFAFEAAAYIEQGEIYHLPVIYRHLFNKPLNQAHIKEIAYFAQPKLMEDGKDPKEHKGRHQLLSVLGLYSQDELEGYLAELNEFATKANEDFAVSLDSGNDHRIGLGYDAATKKWKLIDLNQPDSKPIAANDLADCIKNAFFNEKSNFTGFRTVVFCRKNQCEKLESLAEALKANARFKELHEVTSEKAARVTQCGMSLAYLAVKNNDFATLAAVTRFKNADLNQALDDGTTFALMAAYNSHAEMLKVLVDAKNADNSCRVDLNKAGVAGATPIFMVVQNNNLEALKILVDAKNADGSYRVDLNQASSDGATPALVAAQEGHLEALRILVDARNADGSYRVDLDKANADGYTPAHLAAHYGHVAILKLLAEAGADIGISNKGVRPFDVGVKERHQPAIDFFNAWMVRCQLIIEIEQKHGAAGNVFIGETIQDFHDDHQRFLDRAFVQAVRENLGLVNKQVGSVVISAAMFPPTPLEHNSVEASKARAVPAAR